jgi:hypothetical protein
MCVCEKWIERDRRLINRVSIVGGCMELEA